MTNEQNDAVLETLTRIAANQTEMRRDLQRLVRRVARIEERLDGADKHLHRIERCLKMWRGRGRAMAADRAAAEPDLPGSAPGGVRPLKNPARLPSGEALIQGGKGRDENRPEQEAAPIG
jgi:hypothetical protein